MQTTKGDNVFENIEIRLDHRTVGLFYTMDNHDTLKAIYKESRNESKDLTAARVAVEMQLWIGKDTTSNIQNKPSIHERLEANKTKIEGDRQKKPSHNYADDPKGGNFLL